MTDNNLGNPVMNAGKPSIGVPGEATAIGPSLPGGLEPPTRPVTKAPRLGVTPVVSANKELGAALRSIEWKPFGKGIKVPFLGSSMEEVSAALRVAFEVRKHDAGYSYIRLSRDRGACDVLRGMAAVNKEGANEANVGKEPYSALLQALENSGEIEIRLYGV